MTKGISDIGDWSVKPDRNEQSDACLNLISAMIVQAKDDILNENKNLCLDCHDNSQCEQCRPNGQIYADYPCPKAVTMFECAKNWLMGHLGAEACQALGLDHGEVVSHVIKTSH